MKDRTTYGICITLILMIWTDSRAQEVAALGPWKLKSVSGSVETEALYQVKNYLINETPDQQKSYWITGGFHLNTLSYLYKPEIITFQISGAYSPEARDEKYIYIPDRSEVRSLKKLDFRTSIFSERPLSISSWISYDQNYFNRENLTNIKSENRQLGGMLSYNNRVLPVKLNILSQDWQQEETESGRLFTLEKESIQLSASKSFRKTDKHEFSYHFEDYSYRYDEIARTQNRVNRASLNNQVFFDEDRKYIFQSHISYYDQNGSYTFQKSDISEQLILHLPKHFDAFLKYNYYQLDNTYQLYKSNQVSTKIQHQLYESLRSAVFTEYGGSSRDQSRKRELKAGGELKYTKKIPRGRLNINYRYQAYLNRQEGESGIVFVVNEAHVLNDAEPQFLNRPYADPQSLLLSDITGSIIYQEGLDFFIDSLDNYLEIIRLPGGKILPGQEVLVSYSYINPGSYKYSSSNHHLYTSLSFFEKLVELYYTYGSQNFIREESAEYLTLNTFQQHLVGCRLYFKGLSGGVEYEEYASNIIPYQRINYHLNFHFKLSKKVVTSGNLLIRDYRLLAEEVKQLYSNMSLRMSYQVSRNSRAAIQLAYLDQKGRNIDLNLFTSRLEYETHYRKLYLTTGIIIYARNYTNSNFNYSRAYLTLSRKF